MWWDQPPQIPASVPSPLRCSLSSWTESTETLHPKVAFLGEFCPGNTSSNWYPRQPRKYIIQICLMYLYCNTSSDVTGSLEPNFGQQSKYLLISVRVRTSPFDHLHSEPRFLQSFWGPSISPAVWTGTAARHSAALHSAAAAWCTDLLFNCAMWSLKDFVPPSFLLNSQDEIGFWSATLFSSSLPWGRVAKKDFCFVPFCLQSSG